MRGYVLAVVMVVLGVSCGTTSVTTADRPEEADQVGGEVDTLRVGCPNGPFFSMAALDSQPPLIENSSVPEVAEALAPFLESDEGDLWPQDGWRVLDVIDADRVLVIHPGTPEIPTLAFMTAEWSSDGWRWSGASIPNDCVLMVEPSAEDGVLVDWVIEPDAEPLGPDTTTLALLATERGCAGGQPMSDRLNDPEVTVTADAVLILLTAQPPQGGQDCPSNPSQRVEIELLEPLGEREVRDASVTDLGDLRDVLQELIEGEQSQANSNAAEADSTGEEATTTSATAAQPEPECDSETASGIARRAVDALIARLVEGAADGNFQPAADLWNGFYTEPDATDVLQALVESNPWLLDGQIQIVAVDSYSDPRFCPGTVAAVTDQRRRGTFAVLVDLNGTIHRIQGANDLPAPPDFNPSQVALPTSPTEGSAVAYLESTRLPDHAITVEAGQDTTVISVPPSNQGPRLLIVSMATPELSTAYSVIVPG